MVLDSFHNIFEYYLKNFESIKSNKTKEIIMDKLSKLISNIISIGKKSFTNSAYEDIYDTVVDFIIMISKFKINVSFEDFLFELLKTDNVFSENTYIGLKSFIALSGIS
jgi:hypothetical protein